MPRKTPIKELLNEETTVSSPLRRSSRISNNSPAPTKVTTRRSSATETSSTSTPKVTKGRRASFSQELEAKNENETEAKNSKVSSTPRTRRGSFSSKTSENNVSEEEAGVTKRTTRGSSVSKEQSADVKKPTTRRRRSVSQEVEIPEEAPTPKATRSRSSSATKKNEKAENEKSEENSTEESEALNSEVANIMAKSSSTETINKTLATSEEVNEESSKKDESKVSTIKKKKTDKLKVDLDLSVINETSLTEDDIISSEERKSPVTHEETINEDKLENASEVKSSEITSSEVEHMVKDATTSKNSTATEITTEKSVETEDSSSTTEKPEVNNELKSSSALEENAPKKENGIMETSDSPTSDGSFNLHISSSVLESTNRNETNENTSPLSNKENIRPSDKPAEPMDVDEPDFENSSFGNLSKIQSPLPASPKSRTAAILNKELRIAEKVADEIDQFLKEETKFESSSKSKRSRLSLKSSSEKEKNTSENEIAVTEELVKQDKQSLVLNTEQQLEETTVNENGEVGNISKQEEKSSPSSEEVMKENISTSVFEEVYEKKEEVAVPVEEDSDESIHLEITDDSLADPKIAETIKESIQENVEVEVVSKEETEKVTKEDMQVTVEKNTPVVESESSDLDKLEENTKEVFQKESLKETEKTQNEDDGHLEESTEINVGMNETINDTETKIDESFTFEKTDSEISQNKDQHSLEETEPEDDIPQLVPVTPSGEEPVKETEELLQSENLNKETTEKLDESSHGNTETEKKDITEDSSPKEKIVDVLNSSTQELKSNKDLAEDVENKEEIVEKTVSVSMEIEKESVENNQTLKKSPQIIIKSDILIQPSVCKEVTESTSPSTKEVINETFTESKDEVNRTIDLNQEVCHVDSFIEKENKSPQKKIRAKSQIIIDCTNSSSEEEEDVVNEHKRKSIDQEDVTDSKYEIVENIKGRIEIIKVEESTPESPDVVVLSDNEKEAEIVDNKAVEEIDEKEILVSSDNENDVKEEMIEAAKVADSSTMSQKKRSLDKTSIVMQGNIKAGEDKERRLSDRIHKVVDLFCAGIKNNSDVAVNVSLEYTGHFSDSDSEALPKKDTVEVTLTAEDQKQTSNLKGSKRRKLYNPEEEDVLVQSLVDQEQEMDSRQTEKENKNETSIQINNKKKKKKKSATFSESDISIPSPQTSKRSPSAKQEGEEFTSPVKKQRMYKDTPYKSAKSNKKLVINNKEDKGVRKKNQNSESENADKSTKRKSDSSEDTEQEDKEENKKNDQKSTEWKPFSKYFSSMSESESEMNEDDNDTTWGPSREIDMDDTVLSSEEEEAEEEEDSMSDILEEEEDTSDVLEEEEDASDVLEEEEEPPLIIRSPIQHILRKESKSKQSGSTSEDNAEMSFTCTMKKSDLFSSSSSESDVFNSTTISKKSPSPKGNKKLIQSQILKVEEVTVEEKKKQKKKDVEEKMNNDKQKEGNKVTSKENKKTSPIKSTKEELTASEKKPKKRRHPTYVVSEEEAVIVKKPSLVSQKIPKVVVSEVPSSKLQVSKKECQKTINSKQSSKKSGKRAKTTYLKPSTTMSTSEWDVKILP